MNKLLLGTVLLALASVIPTQSMAGVDINIGISLPPPIVFQAPPEVIVLPDTDDVYVDPYIDVDLFFWNGWWWRFWEGRWYRSYYYDRGWVYYSSVPAFYFEVDPGWRGYYRDHAWHGHRWDYQRIPYQHLQQNWRSWHNDRHWERQGTWGVQNYQPRLQQHRQELSQQGQAQYQGRPEVRRVQRQWQQSQGQYSQVQNQRQPQQRQPQVQWYQQQGQGQQRYSLRNLQGQPRRQTQTQERERQQYQLQVQPQRQPQFQRQQQQRQPQIRESQRQWQSQRQHSQPTGEQQRGRSQHQQSQGENGRHRG